jgi:hypothetical protein
VLGAGRVCCVGGVVPRWVFTGIGGCVLSVSGWCVGGVGMIECKHETVNWFGGSADTVIALNGGAVGECLECGLVAYV